MRVIGVVVVDENAVDEGLRAWSAAVEAGVSAR
jgi:4-aminobutyrate aminotransferase